MLLRFADGRREHHPVDLDRKTGVPAPWVDFIEPPPPRAADFLDPPEPLASYRPVRRRFVLRNLPFFWPPPGHRREKLYRKMYYVEDCGPPGTP